jgi:hypothetical protein
MVRSHSLKKAKLGVAAPRLGSAEGSIETNQVVHVHTTIVRAHTSSMRYPKVTQRSGPLLQSALGFDGEYMTWA